MLKSLIATALTLFCTTPTFARECFYREGLEGQEVVETADGYDIRFQGETTDHCVVTQKEGEPWADCEAHHDGWVVFAGADVNDPTPGEILVLSYGVYFEVCE